MYFWECILAIVAGSLLPLQAAINAILKVKLGSPWYATFVSVLVSTLAVAALCLVIRAPLPNFGLIAAENPWWIWSGGLLGVVFVACALSLAPVLGATTLLGSVIGGQLLCSLLLDQFGLFGIPLHPMNTGRFIGLIFLAIGVFLIQKY